jgi:CheY-like chemotaxis protein
MPTILLVDDDAISRYVLKSVLEDRGYSVLSATPKQALDIADVHTPRIDVLVTDIRMGRVDGFEVARCLLEQRPDLKVIYVSGYPYPECSLLKPFTPEELVAVIEAKLTEAPARMCAGCETIACETTGQTE